MQPAQYNWPMTKEITVNLAQAAGSYDLTTATLGDVLIENYSIYVQTAGATFTSAAIVTDDTTVFNLMTAAEGAVANLTLGKQMVPANQGKAFTLSSGKKIRLTMAGSTGTGSLRLSLTYYPANPTTNAYLS